VDLIASRRSAPSAHRREPPLHPVFSAGLPAILPEFVQAVSASTVTTPNAGAEALLACDGLEALLIPNDGRLDLDDEDGDRVVELAHHVTNTRTRSLTMLTLPRSGDRLVL
jgi:hypothetical protein